MRTLNGVAGKADTCAARNWRRAAVAARASDDGRRVAGHARGVHLTWWTLCSWKFLHSVALAAGEAESAKRATAASKTGAKARVAEGREEDDGGGGGSGGGEVGRGGEWGRRERARGARAARGVVEGGLRRRGGARSEGTRCEGGHSARPAAAHVHERMGGGARHGRRRRRVHRARVRTASVTHSAHRRIARNQRSAAIAAACSSMRRKLQAKRYSKIWPKKCAIFYFMCTCTNVPIRSVRRSPCLACCPRRTQLRVVCTVGTIDTTN